MRYLSSGDLLPKEAVHARGFLRPMQREDTSRPREASLPGV